MLARAYLKSGGLVLFRSGPLLGRVVPEALDQQCSDLSAQGVRAQDFDLGPMAQYLHRQFAALRNRYRVAAGFKQVDDLVDAFGLAHSMSHYSRHDEDIQTKKGSQGDDWLATTS